MFIPLNKIVKKAKATDEKIQEARQLESMYEQELAKRREREGSNIGDKSD